MSPSDEAPPREYAVIVPVPSVEAEQVEVTDIVECGESSVSCHVRGVDVIDPGGVPHSDVDRGVSSPTTEFATEFDGDERRERSRLRWVFFAWR